MNSKKVLDIGLTTALMLILVGGLAVAQESASSPLITAFTYQGRLNSDGVPYSGSCDFQFSLWDAISGGTEVGSTQTVTNVSLVDGNFTVQLDYGEDKFQGEARWLEIYVGCPVGIGTYTQLLPRQPLTASPYAFYSKAAPWSGLVDVPAGFADSVDNDTTYSVGTGLTLSSTTLSADTSYLQQRVSGTCSTGNAIRVVASDGQVTCQPVDANSWLLTGNDGTVPSTNFLGTIDNQSLEVRVNRERALRLEPAVGWTGDSSPNLIGGYSGNWITDGAFGATIGGGGEADYVNRVTDVFGTVGGGSENQAGNGGDIDDAPYATVSGGLSNTASGLNSTICGGAFNIASGHAASVAAGSNNTAGGENATVGGGILNYASGLRTTIAGGETNLASGSRASILGGAFNIASGDVATVCGGHWNTASGGDTTISGGYYNLASAWGSTIGGGRYNNASATFATISGGGPLDQENPGTTSNRVTDDYGTVGGGGNNQAGNNAGNPNDRSYATVGGGASNTASGEMATVSGGAYNSASATRTTVGGGAFNLAIGDWATVGGGNNNEASGFASTVSGGGPTDPNDPETTRNRAIGNFATIGGGGYNFANGTGSTISGGLMNNTSAENASVGGGSSNTAYGNASTISGGIGNTASGEGATVAGGISNTASGIQATVGGGWSNIASNDHATVGGGNGNLAGGHMSTVAGGTWNTAGGWEATVGGGNGNTANGATTTISGGGGNSADGDYATIGGGWSNTASGAYATISGGYNNLAQGDYSFAAGHRTRAFNNGCFVWADSVENDVVCDIDNLWVARASGGVTFLTSADNSTGVFVSPGGNSWNSISDRATKENFSPADEQTILKTLASLPVQEYNLKSQDDSIRHVGLVAQDFATFGFGESDTAINMEDADGVALAAIQALYAENQTLRAENDSQQSQIDAFEARLAALETTSHNGGSSRTWQMGLLSGLGLLVAGLVWVTRRGGRAQ